MIDRTAKADTSAVVACSLSEQELTQRSQEVARDLFAFAEQIDELPDGYTWRFPGDDDWHAKLLHFVAAERRCCGFFRIELVFEPGLGPVSLTLRGPDGTKAFINETFVVK
jgi:hypothetical protein